MLVQHSRLLLLALAFSAGLFHGEIGHAQCLQQKVTRAIGDAEDRFGASVAMSDDFLVVGAVYDDQAASNAGAAYVYRRDAGGWVADGVLLPSSAPTDDEFGGAVATNRDRIAVGAVYDDDGGANAGAVYVYRREPSGWVLESKLLADDAGPDNYLGASLDMSGDRLIAGAPGVGGKPGSTYVFLREGSSWTQEARLVAPDPEPNARFGTSVGMGTNRCVVGAFWRDAAGTDSGSAYVFKRTNAGWTVDATLLPAGLAAGDNFGLTVAMSGNEVVVGAQGADTALGSDTGAAYVFQRSASGWTQTATLVPGDLTPGSYASYPGLAIAGDTVIVGVPQAASQTGAAYVFQKSGTTWSQSAKFLAPDAATGSIFGYSVAINQNRVAVSAPWSASGGSPTGAVYVMSLREDCGCKADLNKDGLVDIHDYYIFMSAYNAGCGG
ncbi:MAG: FG-GAP repeat protein [Phycisphaerales bacterium]